MAGEARICVKLAMVSSTILLVAARWSVNRFWDGYGVSRKSTFCLLADLELGLCDFWKVLEIRRLFLWFSEGQYMLDFLYSFRREFLSEFRMSGFLIFFEGNLLLSF